jgi:hypothetical protein
MTRTFYLLTVSALILLINYTQSKNLIINSGFSQNPAGKHGALLQVKPLSPVGFQTL